MVSNVTIPITHRNRGIGIATISVHFYFADHSGFHVTGDQAGKVNRSCLVERPDQVTALTWFEGDHVGFNMLHAGRLFHVFGMSFQF